MKWCMVSVGRRTAVHFCPCWAVDWHVPLQVQANEANPHVQRPQAPDLLPLQHCEFMMLKIN